MESISHKSADDRWLDRLYELPQPMLNDLGWNRQYHFDLEHFGDEAELLSELRRIRRRLDYDRDPWNRAWLDSRSEAVHAELARRRPQQRSTQTSRYPATPSPSRPRPVLRDMSGGGRDE